MFSDPFFRSGCLYMMMGTTLYGTHAIGPMTALSGTRMCRGNCFGSGTMEDRLTRQYGNPCPVESAPKNGEALIVRKFRGQNGRKQSFVS